MVAKYIHSFIIFGVAESMSYDLKSKRKFAKIENISEAGRTQLLIKFIPLWGYHGLKTDTLTQTFETQKMSSKISRSSMMN